MAFTFPKKEHLKKQKLIALLFKEGQSITIFPLKLLYAEAPLPEAVFIQSGFSVSKRNFKHAVDRNRIKRVMRECYRSHKNIIFNNGTTSYAFMFLYLGRAMPDFHILEATMKNVLEKFKTTALQKIHKKA